MTEIIDIVAREIFDSRGNPTLEVEVELLDGSFGRASVPSGASTGTHEALELRDNDPNRFGGKGVTKACQNIESEIFLAIQGMDVRDQRRIDQIMQNLDGTGNKSRLGANATLGVSLAIAHAAATCQEVPLYRYLGGVNVCQLPVPLVNVINGGEHANNGLAVQEFMIVPVGAQSFSHALQMSAEVFYQLKQDLSAAGHSTNVGDEGGFAPNFTETQQALDILTSSIAKAGYEPGGDIYLALDCAASEFFSDSKYQFDGESLSAEQMIEKYHSLVDKYPIISIEDGLSEDDWDGWKALNAALGERVQLVGDDLFVTNIERLTRGINDDAANSILIKPNQIGTLTETIDTVRQAQLKGYSTIMSHRSGETEDTTIADLAVALSCTQIKTGSVSRTDRLAKYNQLLRIEDGLSDIAIYAGSNAFASLGLQVKTRETMKRLRVV